MKNGEKGTEKYSRFIDSNSQRHDSKSTKKILFLTTKKTGYTTKFKVQSFY